MAEAGDGLELSADAGFLQHLPLHRLGQVFVGVQRSTGQLQRGRASSDAVDFAHHQQLALLGQHHSADADIVSGEVRQPGALLENDGQHQVVFAAVVEAKSLTDGLRELARTCR